MLYRLAASPGRRALLGMPRARRRVIRPLLRLHARGDRRVLRASAGCRGARTRPTRRGATRATACATSCCRRCARCTRRPRRTSCARSSCCATRPRCSTRWSTRRSTADVDARSRRCRRRCARLAVQRLAGEPAPVAPRAPTTILALGARGGTAALDLGGGLRAVVEYGRLRFDARAAARRRTPARAARARARRLRRRRAACERGELAIADGTLDADALAPTLEVRAWRPGDRMRPLGLGGSRSRCRTSSPTARSRASDAAPAAGGGLRRRDRLGPGRRDRRALPSRDARPRGAGVRLAWRLDCAPHAPRRAHRRDPRPGRRPPAPHPGAGGGDLARLRGQGPAADRRPQGRRVLPGRPDAPPRRPVRGRLHGRRLLRLVDRLLAASCGSSRTSTRRSRAATS